MSDPNLRSSRLLKTDYTTPITKRALETRIDCKKDQNCIESEDDDWFLLYRYKYWLLMLLVTVIEAMTSDNGEFCTVYFFERSVKKKRTSFSVRGLKIMRAAAPLQKKF